jgi:N-acetylmuramoyl-L-alanine amidase
MNFNLKYFYLTVTILLLSSAVLFSQNQLDRPFTVVLDAGHGGSDPGTEGNKKHKNVEKDIVLKVVTKVGKMLKDYSKNIKIVYTRDKDVFVKLKQRPSIANENNADLFISVHCNAVDGNKRANGVETYVLGTHKNNANFEVAKKENSVIFLEEDHSVNYSGFDPNDPTMPIAFTINASENFESSLEFASIVQGEMVNGTAIRDRGVRQAGFWVLHQTSMPSVLIEMGYLSNDSDAAYLNSSKGQLAFSKSIFESVIKYKNSWDRKRGSALTEIAKIQQNDNEVSFAVQFLSLTNKVDINDERFKGLKDIVYYQYGKYYRYVYQKTTDFETAIANQKKLRSLGFKDAFVIALKGENRIDVLKAKKMLNQ